MQTFSFSVNAAFRDADEERKLASFWNRSLESIVSVPSLQQLDLELELYDPTLSGQADNRHPSFLNSLRWSLIDRSGMELWARPVPLQAVRIAIWSQDLFSPLSATKKEFADLVKSNVSQATRDILSFKPWDRPRVMSST